MKELDPKRTEQVAGGEVTSTTPLTGVDYPILQLPDPEPQVKALLVPEPPLP